MRPWTSKEIQFVRDNWLNLTRKEMAHELNRSISSVQGIVQRLNLSLYKSQRWSEEEDEMLRDLLSRGYSVQYIANRMDRTLSSIMSRRRYVNQ